MVEGGGRGGEDALSRGKANFAGGTEHFPGRMLTFPEDCESSAFLRESEKLLSNLAIF